MKKHLHLTEESQKAPEETGFNDGNFWKAKRPLKSKRNRETHFPNTNDEWKAIHSIFDQLWIEQMAGSVILNGFL